MLLRLLRVVGVLLVCAATVGVASPSGAATTRSTAEYASRFCQAGGSFTLAIAVASNGLNVSSTELTTAKAALIAFADDARSATETFRSSLNELRTVRSPAIRALNAATIAKLQSIEKTLATMKADAGTLNVTDQSAFGIRLVLVQKDIQKISDGFASIGKIKYPKELARAVAKDSVCRQLQGTAPTTTGP